MSSFAKPAPCFILVSSLILLLSCKKTSAPPNPLASSTHTIYVLGNIGGATVYWKNGEVTQLTSPAAGMFGENGFFVSGSDLYIAGTIPLSPATVTGYSLFGAEYLKNSIPTILPDSSADAYAYGISVAGSDVYVAGLIAYRLYSKIPYTTPTATYPKFGNVATLWKNGTPISLPSQEFIGLDSGDASLLCSDYVTSMCTAGNDIYVAGGSNSYQMGNPSTYHFAEYWKDGVPTYLNAGLLDSAASSITSYPATSGICVSGNDVYVAGYERVNGVPHAIYWKDGVPVMLSNTSVSGANGITVSGGDVYVAGQVTGNNGSIATLWKNGVTVNLGTPGSGSVAQAVAISGSDVYIAGTDIVDGAPYATVWINGTPDHLSGNANANAIIIQ